ncbi:MAG: tetratricopeptide repeat protein [Myxococcota bacterium]|jgi:Flp pilus assembly protein TadD|nr:tetratricopeptide repeat protein [Myxococcota bacterium]
MSEARTHYKAGIQHFAAGRTDEAIASYRAALAGNAEFAMAWNGLAMALAKQGDLDAALDAARRYAELDPEEPLAYTSLSMLLQQAGRIPEAEDAKARSMQLQMKQGR